MRKDYHMHPTVLKTPERFAEFVQRAREKGIQEICVTDHMPLSLSKAKDRLERGTVADYCACVRRFAEEYWDQISIKCGIEIDYHPSVLGEIEEVLAQGSFDLILGSTHLHLFEEKRLSQYTFNDFAEISIENSIRAVESGLFDILTHPDMFRFPFSNPVRFPLIPDEYSPERHENAFKALLKSIKSRGMCLEINPHLAEGSKNLSKTYPQEPILNWALEMGVRFSYGSDAHTPHSVGALLDELEAHPIYGRAVKDFEETV